MGQSFDIEYKNILNEMCFEITYTGPPGEILIPRLARISYIQNDLKYVTQGDDRILVKKVDDQEEIYSVQFSYTMITHDAIGVGIKSQSWYPILKDIRSEYTVRDSSENTLFIFPFDTIDKHTFTFSTDKEDIWLFLGNHTLSQNIGAISTICYSNSQIETASHLIIPIYEHLVEFFGNLGITNIVLIQSSLASMQSFVSGNKLYVTLPNRGTLEQVRRSMVAAWEKKRNIGTYFFSLFKDTVLRLTKIASSENEESLNVALETDPKYIVLVPPSRYYQEWIASQDWKKNEIISIRTKDMVENYALLHMAWYNIGVETLLKGIKIFFQQTPMDGESPTPINWQVITQNQLKEPVFSLYTKEILIEKDAIIPHIEAKEGFITRNSMNIPNLSIRTDSDIIDILWNNERSTAIPPLKGRDYYILDSTRQIPQQSFIGSFYTTNKDVEREHLKALDLAKKYPAPGEQHFRKHLDIVEIPNLNRTTNDAVKTFYVVVTHILSNTTGQLADAIKETTIAVQQDGSMKIINTQLRV